MAGQRPPVKIRFRYNVVTGEIEEFIVDDNAPDRSESYHRQVAELATDGIARRPVIEDAGPRGQREPARSERKEPGQEERRPEEEKLGE